jgi:hypothetical protein
MAIEALYLQMLKQAIEARHASGTRLAGLLLGYPDLVVPQAALTRLAGADVVSRLPQRGDAQAIWSYHGLGQVTDPLYDSVALLREMGVDAEVIDMAKHRGMERVVDLNEPLPADLVRRFDLVVDTGTCEHCFNVGRAFLNACEALARGGMLVHAAPLTRMNHGFWNFNPTVYPDFFEHNGFRLLTLTGVTGDLANGMRPFGVEAFNRFEAPPGAAMYVVAERVEVRDLGWPVQRKYGGMAS